MTNAQSNLLQLAKQGDPKAIAALMNRSLQPKFTAGYGAFVMAIISIIEGIIYLTKSDREFVQTSVSGKKGWF